MRTPSEVYEWACQECQERWWVDFKYGSDYCPVCGSLVHKGFDVERTPPDHDGRKDAALADPQRHCTFHEWAGGEDKEQERRKDV